MAELKFRIHLGPFYAAFENKCPESLVRPWEGPLLPRKTMLLIPPGDELDIVWAEVKGHSVVFHKNQVEIVFIELEFNEDSTDYIVSEEVRGQFVEAMLRGGWFPD